MKYLLRILASLLFVPLYAYASVPNEMVGNWCLTFTEVKELHITYRSEVLIKADGSFITTIQVLNGPIVKLKSFYMSLLLLKFVFIKVLDK